MLNLADSMAESLVAAHLDMQTRFPVTERPGDAQFIVGYVHFKDVDLPRPDVRNLSEWVAAHLGHPVRGGDVIERNRLRVLVRKVR